MHADWVVQVEAWVEQVPGGVPQSAGQDDDVSPLSQIELLLQAAALR